MWMEEVAVDMGGGAKKRGRVCACVQEEEEAVGASKEEMTGQVKRATEGKEPGASVCGEEKEEVVALWIHAFMYSRTLI